ncbi:hypothetical protein FQN54_009770 [Arachnomyces sp. PD_36]|nr:hypothetical protein FQN54_009770 [Arachnomyces sp. PD_36]
MKLSPSLWALAASITTTADRALCISVINANITDIAEDVADGERLITNSFQQDAIVSFNGYQYVATYTTSEYGGTINHVTVGRRTISPTGDWEFLTLNDYNQTTDDGHNVVSIGISAGDGRIHLSFDHHDDDLHYRASEVGVASDPPTAWDASIFGEISFGSLPGVADPIQSLTYPRFERLSDGGILFEARLGSSGSGDSWLWRYSPTTGEWETVGLYHRDSESNAYINGIDFHNDTLQVSWTLRETPDVVTNHDLYYAYSEDIGQTWKNSAGDEIADLSADTAITPTSDGILIFEIPQNSGVLNQEAQAVHPDGSFHVLNRENTSGEFKWYHYRRSASGEWTRNEVDIADNNVPIQIGSRGKFAITRGGVLLLILNGNLNSNLNVYATDASSGYQEWEPIWDSTGYDTEPLVDKYRLRDEDVLSLLVRQDGDLPGRKIQVIDLVLGE